MNNFFDKTLHYLGKKSKNITALNIGSMDGIMFDEMIGYTNMYNFKVLYVEPVPYLFEKLQHNIRSSSAMFENSAISEYNGMIDMLTIDKEIIDSGLVHSCFYGMSAVYPPKNGLGSEFDRPTVEKYGKLIKVPCITFNTLVLRHNLKAFDIVKIDTEGHDYKIFKQIDLNKYKPKIIRIEWINLEEYEQNDIIKIFNEHNYVYEISGQDIVGMAKYLYEEIDGIQESVLQELPRVPMNNINSDKAITFVTGLWDLGRECLEESWARSYGDHYLKKFEELLTLKHNLIIFGNPDLEEFVWKFRDISNTKFYTYPKDNFKDKFPFFNQVQKIRNNPEWYNQVEWLKTSTQAKLEYYNPMVMSKMFLLNDAKIFDPFHSDYFFWIDGGISQTLSLGYFNDPIVVNNLKEASKKFFFICFPYETNNEIHGFNIGEMNKFAKSDHVNRVARGGFFGGKKEYLAEANGLYYSLLDSSLGEGSMGTEENIFTMMTYLDSDTYKYETIDDNGLIYACFEKFKLPSYKSKSSNISLYINTFNSPQQLQMVLDSFEKNDPTFLDKPTITLVNNSTNESLFSAYDSISKKYNMKELRMGNLGICGARQFIAEDFHKSTSEYMLFFEDDMLVDLNGVCPMGFNKRIDNLLDVSIRVMIKEKYDFLKLSFSEFFGHNGEQWSWHNVPNPLKTEYFGDIKSRPLTIFNNIKSLGGIPYIDGEIYYSNWPHIIGKTGNKKMFLDTTWAHPYEQTWMSHTHTLIKQKIVKSAIFLASPITHNRIHFYDGKERKES